MIEKSCFSQCSLSSSFLSLSRLDVVVEPWFEKTSGDSSLFAGCNIVEELHMYVSEGIEGGGLPRRYKWGNRFLKTVSVDSFDVPCSHTLLQRRWFHDVADKVDDVMVRQVYLVIYVEISGFTNTSRRDKIELVFTYCVLVCLIVALSRDHEKSAADWKRCDLLLFRSGNLNPR